VTTGGRPAVLVVAAGATLQHRFTVFCWSHQAYRRRLPRSDWGCGMVSPTQLTSQEEGLAP
jgi:hypothetical protein